ncbi:MAG TPA: beta-ketoacyl-ACP synthase III [Acidimicrobiales bacterium]|nr:beta-ketoacyl-ACP synthase III [Acidimicrobiales bacterium]
MGGIRIVGWGTALPDKVITNADLEARLDTTDEWITERSGIRERRVGGTTTELAVGAGRAALAKAGLEPTNVDLLVLATTTPDQAVPATSAAVSHELGLHCGGFDLNAACAGFVYSLVAASGMATGHIRNVLLIGSETLSRVTDWEDRSTAVLFADGAGAVVLQAVEGPGDLLGWDLGLDGSLRPILYADLGGFIVMEGREVFRRAVRATVESATQALRRSGVSADEIALFVPHQANIRIIDAAGQRLGIPRERTAVVLDRTGNTSSASIPLALADAADAGRLSPGDLVLLSGFGAGMTWASAVVRWSA